MATIRNAPKLPLSFIDYMRIRQTLDADKESPNSKVTSHDQDKVTYNELYQSLMYFSKDYQHYVDAYSATLIDTIGFLVDTLKHNQTLSDQDYQNILNNIKKIWEKKNETRK